MFIMRRIFTFIVALCFMSSLCLTVLADGGTYYLDQGSISIGFQNDVQHVTQNDVSTPDSNPTITSNGTTSNTITVSSGEGQTAQFTVENLNIDTDRGNSAIDITKDSTAVITVQGENNAVDNTHSGSGEHKATIHVGDGASLTIQGSDTPPKDEDNQLRVNRNNAQYSMDGSAGIGSNKQDNFTGSITITGDVYVEAGAPNHAAAIGAGYNGHFSDSATVEIKDGANVHVEAGDKGTGIGAGNNGDFNGSVNITDSTVYADTYSNGAGIGAGMNGDFSGKVNIEDSDVTAISGHSGKGEGAGIGAGFNGNFSGKVNITDSVVYAKATNDGAGIGAGGTDNGSKSATEFTAQGQVNIHNSKVTADTRSQGIPIGAPESLKDNGKFDGIFNGTINITGNSEVTLIDGRNTALGEQVLIGGADANSSGNVSIEDSAKITYWAGDCPDKGEIDNGSFGTATQEQLNQIIQGAEIEVVVVPKTAAAYEVPVYRFWDDVEAMIKTAEKGDTITIDVKDRTSIPVRILELVAEYEVTLVIQWNGGEDIMVAPDHGIEVDADTILLTKLISLLKK